MSMTPQRRQLNPVKVRAARRAAGLTKAAAATAAQVSRPAYNRWENAEKGPLRVFDTQRAELLCSALKVELDDLTDPLELDDPSFNLPADRGERAAS